MPKRHVHRWLPNQVKAAEKFTTIWLKARLDFLQFTFKKTQGGKELRLTFQQILDRLNMPVVPNFDENGMAQHVICRLKAENYEVEERHLADQTDVYIISIKGGKNG